MTTARLPVWVCAACRMTVSWNVPPPQPVLCPNCGQPMTPGAGRGR